MVWEKKNKKIECIGHNSDPYGEMRGGGDIS